MFPLWDVAIEPVLDAVRATRVVEIGAFRGETTVRMLERLGPEAELHVIDPVPDFDPGEHERAFPGRYYFHQGLSLQVLPGLEPMDVALIDGDHNWYTVYHELRLLAEGARRGGAPLPVMILHDVLWPYGRRDLYYDPSNIPAEHRRPYATRGIKLGMKRLAARGGLNPTMYNAVEEGGPRNGVMTALEDWMAEHDRPLRRLVLPVYFGLAIVVEEERLERQPELAALLDRLESAEVRGELLEVAEHLRLKAMLFQHNALARYDERQARAANRYLEVVKGSLLNEHYLDHERRFELLANRIHGGPLPVDALRDPARHDQAPFRQLQHHRSGPGGPDDTAGESFVPYTAMGRGPLDHLHRCLDEVHDTSVPGDLVEVGTGRGGGAIFMRAWLEGNEVPDRAVWVADRFRASPDPQKAPELPRRGVAGFQADLNLVRDGFQRFGVLDERVHFLQGPPSATLPSAEIGDIAVLRIGRTVGDVAGVLEHLYDKVADGGFVVVEFRPSSTAVADLEAFFARRGLEVTLERVGGSAVAWRRQGGGLPSTAVVPLAATAPRPPLAGPAPADQIDLTVVVVFYNMRREAARTLHSLSRSYQEGVADTSYEVIVVENGSADDQKLGASFVAGFGPEFRYLDLGDEAEPSPVLALNRGIRAGRGRTFALMIDGAHVLTPGVLRFGLAGIATYSPAIVATQQWYTGPGQQGDVMDDGYDQAYEDRLFEKIKWPAAGYRLFEIGHFVGDRDWLDGMWESNCVFVERRQLEQVGCFDESFSVAGGGYANLELYERLGSSPDVTVATIMGEGSFHQVHGGTTTNQVDPAERRRRVFGYGQEYAELRGRAFRGPGKPIHFVGRIPNQAARRSKSRRMSSTMFGEASAAALDDGLPKVATPVPDELRWAFTEATWRSLPWRSTTWLGRKLTTAPTDLLAYQEIISTVRPDWVIETGTGHGGRALFLASVCELLGHGQVVSVDHESADDLPNHPRLHLRTGLAHERSTVEEVRRVVGEDARAVVILGSCAPRADTFSQFQAYAPFVPVGSYVVVTDTVVNGHPVWPGFGPGPLEGVKQILGSHGEFIQDPAMEKYSLSFDTGGYLKRVR